MSDINEKLLSRLQQLEREVERLRVGDKAVAITDHGALSGLSDDDHPQYLLTTGTAANSTKLANTTPTTAGLNLLSATNVSAQRNLLGISFTLLATLNDDTATSFSPVNKQGFLLYRILATTMGAVISFDAVTGKAYCFMIAGHSSIETRTGVLSGTTGTDGKITISAHTDGKIYVENRLGTTIYGGYITL